MGAWMLLSSGMLHLSIHYCNDLHATDVHINTPANCCEQDACNSIASNDRTVFEAACCVETNTWLNACNFALSEKLRTGLLSALFFAIDFNQSLHTCIAQQYASAAYSPQKFIDHSPGYGLYMRHGQFII